MKKKNSILFFIPFIFLLTGCPYYSDFGLSDPEKSSIDTTLIGRWIAINAETSDTAELTILKFNNHEIYMEFIVSEKNKLSIEKYRGFITQVENQNLINLKRLDAEQRFIFLKYHIENEVMEVSYASDEFITKTLSSEKELLHFFKNNIEKKELFENYIKFRRQ